MKPANELRQKRIQANNKAIERLEHENDSL
jgi:hypothetical protein